MSRFTQIGFNQRVRLEWLEKTTNLILAGNDKKNINDSLQEMLKEKVSVGGKAVRGNREKVVTILMKTWLTVPSELESLRIQGLEIIQHTPKKDQLIIHWGMLLANYPFWGGVAVQVGRLLRLQETASASQIQRRVREQYGERETVSRAARRVLRSYLDWGVLQNANQKGIYKGVKPFEVADIKLIAWLIEAYLLSVNKNAVSISEFMDNQRFFPFRFKQFHLDNITDLNKKLEIVHNGSGDDLVILKNVKVLN